MSAPVSASAGAPVIAIEGLGVRFPGNADWTLEDVSLAVRPNEFVALVGGSGVGKSTLLRVIAGLLPAQAGRVELPGEKVPGRRRRALVFQDGRLMPWRTVAGNVAFGLEGLALPKEEVERRIEEVLALTGLEDFAGRWPHQLSGGQVQRVGIARALAVKPAILLMDEPFSAVDALTRRSLQAELSRIWRQSDAAVVFVTHDIDEALYLSDRVLVLGGRPAGIVEEARVEVPRPRDRRDERLREEAARLVETLE